MVDNIVNSLKQKYNISPRIERGNSIVSPKDNYDRLYYPKNDITKSSKYTRWLSDDKMLRTQMTAIVPGILEKIKEETILICPGLVYRRDVVDKTHVGEPHQMDVWIASNKVKYDREKLLELVGCIIDSILPDTKWRYNETNHHYTKDGIEVEVYVNDKWLEILECGLINPKLLEDSNLDTNDWSGLALGLGLDRAVMIRKNIDDIRILRSKNPLISCQMSNLDIYKQVSKYMRVKRDLSISIDSEMDNEVLGDMIRNVMGKDESLIEEVIIKTETNYDQLPPHVSERLGMSENMKNVLLGITICSLEHQVTSDEANEIYKKIYLNIHQGTKGYI